MNNSSRSPIIQRFQLLKQGLFNVENTQYTLHADKQQPES